MKDKITIAVVGGIPNPIGGVTTFIRRLIAKEPRITCLFDLYPHREKLRPLTFNGRYVMHNNRLLTLLRLAWFTWVSKVDVIHFNFSTQKSLILLKFLPKGDAAWCLTLHHGDLGESMPAWAHKVLRKKITLALALNARQRAWYAQSIPNERIKISSSYIKASQPTPNVDVYNKVASLKKSYDRLFVCSGYPSALYNHLLVMKFMEKRPKDVLVCCLYGSGSLRALIEEEAKEHTNIVLLEGLAEEDFNYILTNCDLYLRVTKGDSFGIAVADARNFNVPVLASNVCERYPGTFIIDVPQSAQALLLHVEQALKGEGLEKSTAIMNEFTYCSLLSEL